MSRLSGFICALLALSVSGTARGASPLAGQKQPFGDIYVGAAAGSAQLNNSDDIADIDVDTDELGYKFFAGYSVGLSSLFDLAIEASYVDFLGLTSSGSLSDDVDDTAWDLFAVGTVNLGPIGVFGKIGSYWWSEAIDDYKDVLNDFGDNMVYGAGVQLKASSFTLRAEYERFDAGSDNVDFISIGASMQF